MYIWRIFISLFGGLLFVGELFAAEIVVDPIKAYVLMGGDSTSYSSMDEFKSNYNANQELIFNKCKSKLPYSCSKFLATTWYPYGTALYHGEPNWYQVNRTRYSESKGLNGDVTTSSGDGGEIGVDVQHSCTDDFGMRSVGPIGNAYYECVKTELQACPADGNPINIGTGEKFESEIDFSTADGFLNVERNYINQFSNWSFDSPESITVVSPGQEVALAKEYSYVKQLKRYTLDPDNPNSVTTYPYIYKIHYVNRTASRLVYFNQGRLRYRFTETASGFIGDGPKGAKIRLVQLGFGGGENPAWKMTLENGDELLFSDSGRLMQRKFSQGGNIFYTFNDGLLTSKTDHFGRTLTYTYDNYARLIAIHLPDGQQITYEYGEAPDTAEFYLLKKVIWPTGENVSYLYNEAPNITGTNTQKMLTGKLNGGGVRIGTYKYNYSKAVSTEGPLGTFKRVMQHYSNYTAVTDGLNSQRLYYFNGLPDGTRLVRQTNQPAGSGCAAATESATFYTDGLKKTETNFNGHKTQFAYEAGRALETVRVEGIPKGNGTDYLPANTALVAGARKITTQWHAQQRKPVKKSEPKLITSFIYNGDADPFNGNQIANCGPANLVLLCHKVQQATIDANGAQGLAATLDNTLAAREEFYTYNAAGQQLTFARSATGVPDETREYYGNTTTNWTLGDLKKTTNALGHVIEFTRYDRNGRLLEMADANGIVSTFTYDVRGRVLSQTVAGSTTTHTYDLNGNRIGSLLPNGVVMTYHYDLAKRLIAVENSLGEKINYEYDVESNLRYERITNAANTQTYVKQHVYDALSRVQNTLNSNNQGSTYLYDAKGNLTGEVDANNKSTSHTLDPLDRLTRTTDQLSGKTDFTYDNQGNITQVKDARNNSTIYAYNAFGDLVSQTSPDTGSTTFVYDANGNRTNSADARGVQISYSYDALQRLTNVSFPSAPLESITYTYDGTTNGSYGVGRLTGIQTASIRLDFEYNAQGLISKKYTQLANTFSSTSYSYDAAGNITAITFPSGRIVNYHYNAQGLIDAITTKANAGGVQQTLINNVGYLPFGPASNFVYGNGLSHTQTYDQDYRLTATQVGGVMSRGYGYDPVNNITSIVNNLNAATNQAYSYDALNRLITASGGYGNLGYSYDAVGNRLSETRNGSTDSYTYPSTSNRLQQITRSAGNRNFTYDAAGNPQQRTADDNRAQTFTFNKSNRLETVSVNGALAATYTYNPLGQRVMKTLANGSKEIYHYDEAGQLISVADGTGATLREYIYWGSQQIAFIANGATYYIHNDHLNTPQVITNQSQQVVWMANYEPFGKLAANQSNSIELFSRFPGQYVDPETGLYYNYFRDYDPSIGRYIESDPIGLEGGINTYAYVGGNPINFKDIYGLLSSAAQAIVDDARCRYSDTLGAHGTVMEERIKIGWESLTPRGQALRDAENYLTNYHYTSDGYVVVVNAIVMGVVASPTWQVVRWGQNMVGKNEHSPASWSAMKAGSEGAWDALVDSYWPSPSSGNCSCQF